MLLKKIFQKKIHLYAQLIEPINILKTGIIAAVKIQLQQHLLLNGAKDYYQPYPEQKLLMMKKLTRYPKQNNLLPLLPHRN